MYVIQELSGERYLNEDGLLVHNISKAKKHKKESCAKDYLNNRFEKNWWQTAFKIIPYQTRPCWTDYFIGLAWLVKERSHDIQTKIGCVITDQKNRILSTGYNGFPAGMRDAELPNIRPGKYKWMRHAERNALDNCLVRPDNGIAYVTNVCCARCTMDLWQEGVRKVYFLDVQNAKCIDEADKALQQEFLDHVSLEMIPVKANLDWLNSV